MAGDGYMSGDKRKRAFGKFNQSDKPKSAGKKNYLVPETAERLDRIASEVKEILEALEGKYQPKFTSDPCPTPWDCYDFLCHLHGEVTAMTDGRPEPLDMSPTHGHSEETIAQVDLKAKEYMQDSNQRLSRWATCDPPGYNEIADIGDIALNMKELDMLRKWIDRVIEWHKQNPERRKSR